MKKIWTLPEPCLNSLEQTAYPLARDRSRIRDRKKCPRISYSLTILC